ncbi:unnamed protein product [Thlaspi arvense]|uniref:Uncharacterized protein n=1 Tax=Thlaspi arvense TaxID=13288 RepID=A0AAU9SIE8_THLAR|nr:unnamed protein product [Thlaspi arvense]
MERTDEIQYTEEKSDGGAKSYKGALWGSGERMKDITDQEKPIEESSKGKGKVSETREEQRSSRSEGLQRRPNGDVLRRFSIPLPPREDRIGIQAEERGGAEDDQIVDFESDPKALMVDISGDFDIADLEDVLEEDGETQPAGIDSNTIETLNLDQG